MAAVEDAAASVPMMAVAGETNALSSPSSSLAEWSVGSATEAAGENATLKAVQEGCLRVRDFAFEDDDVRHRGVGSVVPVTPDEEPEPQTFVALYDFEAVAENELTISAGTRVQMLSDVPGGWALVRLEGEPRRCGLVPQSYLQAMAP